MSATITEIAQKAGVSIATVSRAMNNNASIKDETRRRILRLAQELDYKPNPIARSLSRKRTDTIGVILPEIVDEFFSEFIRGIDEEAYRSNHYVMISSSHSQRNIVETLLEFMGSGRVDGVILMAPRMHSETVSLVRRSKRPVVLVNVCPEVKDVVSFNIDNQQGAYAIVKHLIDHGYQRVGFIHGPEGNCDADERFRGYQAALNENNMNLIENLIIPGDFSVRSGYYGFSRLMSQKEKPDAVFAANDMMAVGIYEAARTSNINIPQDIAVVGFDDVFLSRLLMPRLTTVHVPIAELGSKAIRYLFRMIDGQIDIKQSYREELTAGLVLGGSCGCMANVTHNIF